MKLVAWGSWATLALTLASCRGHGALCAGAECDATAADAGGTGSGGDASGGSAAGVMPAEFGCDGDQSCDNSLACDGSERCVDGSCEAGTRVECTYGTQCAEDGPERCVYASPSPWLVATGLDHVLGLPLAQLAEGGDLAVLAERPRDVFLTGFDRVFWAPDGRTALLRSVEIHFGHSMDLMHFGPGLPLPPASIPQLPNWGDYWRDPVFSRDSRSVLIDDSHTGSYVVALTGQGAPAEPLNSENFEYPAERCAGEQSFLRVEEQQVFVATHGADGEVAARALGAGTATLSPDRELIAFHFQDEDYDTLGVALTACSEEVWFVPFDHARSATFSEDSQTLLLTLEDDGIQVLALASAQSPTTLWATDTVDAFFSPSLSPDGMKLVFRLPEQVEDDAELEPAKVAVVDLGAVEPTPLPLGLPATAELIRLGNVGLLAWSGDGDLPTTILWQSLAGGQQPVTVVGDPAAGLTRVVEDSADPSRVLLLTQQDEKTVLSRLRFDSVEPPQLVELATFVGDVQDVTPLPDDSAIIVMTQGTFSDNKLFWLPLDPQGRALKSRLLAERTISMSIQPWP